MEAKWVLGGDPDSVVMGSRRILLGVCMGSSWEPDVVLMCIRWGIDSIHMLYLCDPVHVRMGTGWVPVGIQMVSYWGSERVCFVYACVSVWITSSPHWITMVPERGAEWSAWVCMRSKWVLDGTSMGSRWYYSNGVPEGVYLRFAWNPNGVQTGNLWGRLGIQTG